MTILKIALLILFFQLPAMASSSWSCLPIFNSKQLTLESRKTPVDTLLEKVKGSAPGLFFPYRFQVSEYDTHVIFSMYFRGEHVAMMDLLKNRRLSSPSAPQKLFGGFETSITTLWQHKGQGLGSLLYLIAQAWAQENFANDGFIHSSIKHSPLAGQMWRGFEDRNIAFRGEVLNPQNESDWIYVMNPLDAADHRKVMKFFRKYQVDESFAKKRKSR